MRKDCENTVTQCLKTYTPIKLKVQSELGDTDIECGKPEICFASQAKCCKKDCFEFVVEQTLMVEIPVKYYISADIGESHIEC